MFSDLLQDSGRVFCIRASSYYYANEPLVGKKSVVNSKSKELGWLVLQTECMKLLSLRMF